MQIGFYGRLRDAIGDVRDHDVSEGMSVSELRRQLADRFPDHSRDLLSPRIRACVDDEIVGDDFILTGRESVEFFPPLSGG